MTGERSELGRRNGKTASEAKSGPVLTVINPDATPEEIAALVAVFAALGSSAADAPSPRRPAWSRPARGVRRMHRSAPDGWRASSLPR